MSYRYDYMTAPIVTDKYVFSDGKGRLHMMLGWLGLGRRRNAHRTPDGRLGLLRYKLSDGTEAQRYPVQKLMPDWSAILYGATDVTGQFWGEILGGRPCWNWLELGGPMTASEGQPVLRRLSDYRKSGAPLRVKGMSNGWEPRISKGEAWFPHPDHWPEPYHSAWFSE